MKYTYGGVHIQWSIHTEKCIYGVTYIRWSIHTLECTYGGVYIWMKDIQKRNIQRRIYGKVHGGEYITQKKHIYNGTYTLRKQYTNGRTIHGEMYIG